MNVTVRVDSEQVRRALSSLSEATSRTAIVRSLNRAVDRARTEATTIATENVAVKLRTARQAITVNRAKSSSLSAAVLISGAPLPLSLLSPSQAKRGDSGVRVTVRKGGGRVLIRGAFIARAARGVSARLGIEGVYSRTPKRGGVPFKRLPIRELFTTSIRQFFKRKSAVKRVTDTAAEAFNAAAQNQIKQALRGQTQA